MTLRVVQGREVIRMMQFCSSVAWRVCKLGLIALCLSSLFNSAFLYAAKDQTAERTSKIQKSWHNRLSSKFSTRRPVSKSTQFSSLKTKKPPQSNNNKLDSSIKGFYRLINSLASKTNFSEADVNRLQSSFENLQAAHLMQLELYSARLAKIESLRLGGQFNAKLEQAKLEYSAILSPVIEQFSTVLSNRKVTRSKNKNVDITSLNGELLATIQITVNLLKNKFDNTSTRILRNNLPFRNSTLTRRMPQSTVSIVPSYNSNEIPTSEALNSNLETPLSESIIQKARELDFDYVRIYEFVHNEIELEWYVGSKKGAEGTLLQMSGNDVDQSSLLIALFRASGLAAQYVHGTIEAPTDWIQSSLGLVDSQQAIDALSKAGVAYSPLVRGGKISAVLMEYTWVSAYVPYSNYRGTTIDRSGEQWLPLMPSYKEHEVSESHSLIQSAGISVNQFVEGYLASLQTTSPREQVNQSVGYYAAGNQHLGSYDELLGGITTVPNPIGLIPNTLPVTVSAVFHESYTLAEQYKQKIRFISRAGKEDSSPILIDKTIPLSQISNRRLTFSYFPATVDDHTLTNSFGGLDLVPSYLVSLRPQIRLEGRKLFTGQGSLEAGVLHRFDIELITPAGTEKLNHTVISGGYHAINLATGDVGFEQVENDPADTEFLGARVLSQLGQEYNKRWTDAENEFSKLLNVAVVRPFPSFNLVSNDMQVETVLGLPQQLKWNGVTLDAGFRMSQAINRNVNDSGQVVNDSKDFIKLSALEGSYLEHQTFEELLQVESISADKGLQVANSLGQSIVRIDSANYSSVITTLNHPQTVLDDIQEWVQKGYQVSIPSDLLSLNSWQGSVWKVEDPTKGNSGYFIAGGLAGGATTVAGDSWILDWLQAALEAANSPEPNANPGAVAKIVPFQHAGYLKGTVGSTIESALTVMVLDSQGAPVIGALVNFQASEGASLDPVSQVTDHFGLARTHLTLAQSTNGNAIYLRQDETDDNLSKASINTVTAEVVTDHGRVYLEQPFNVVAFPDEATGLRNLSTVSEPYIVSINEAFCCLDIIATDQFDNIVSNVDIQISIDSIYDATQCSGLLPEDALPLPDFKRAVLKMGDEEAEQITITSSVIPKLVQPIWGDATATSYPVTISGANSNINYPFEAPPACLDSAFFTFPNRNVALNQNGNIYAAAKPGEAIPTPIEVGLFRTYSDDLPFIERYITEPYTQATMNVLPLIGVTVSTPTYDGEYYSSTVQLGDSPGRFEISSEFTVNERLLGVTPGEPMTPNRFGVVYAVEPSADSVITEDTDDSFRNLIRLNGNDISIFDAQITYQVLPTSYEARSIEVDILEDGSLYKSYIGSSLSSGGTAVLQAGNYFDLEKSYQMQVILNRGTEYEIKSDPQPLPFAIEIIKSASNVVEQEADLNMSNTSDIRLSGSFDSVNNRACIIDGVYDFEINIEAEITLEIGDETLVDAVVYPAGKHSVTIETGRFGHGYYNTTLTAVSTVRGQTEVREGTYQMSLYNKNSLAIGHTLVKGVNVSSGNLTVSGTDFSVAGRHQPLEFTRNYTSNNSERVGSLGVGWSYNFDSYISITQCGEIVINGLAGGGHRFVDDGEGGLEPLAGYHGTLLANDDDNSFDFYSKDGTRYHYKNYSTRNWDLEYIEDTNNNITRFSYQPRRFDLQDKLFQSVTDSSGRIITFTYDYRQYPNQRGLTPVITDVSFNGIIGIAYEYDSWGNLVSVIRDGGERTESYEYGVAERETRHKLLSYTDPNGNVKSYSYNDERFNADIGGAAMVVIPYQVVTSVTEPEIGSTGFSYSFPSFTTTVTNTRGYESSYTYDSSGRVVNLSLPIGAIDTTWVTDDVLIASTTDANGVVTTYSYDENGNRLTETNPIATTTTTYHPPSKFAIGNGEAVKNRVASIQDGNGHVTSYDYDAAGNLVEILNPDGGRITHSYDSQGDRRSTTDAMGNITTFDHDAHGYLSIVNDPNGGSTTTERDIFGSPIEVVDANGNQTTNVFDSLHRLITSTDSLSGETAYEYDAVGNKLSETNANNARTSFTYDGAYRNTQITNALNDTATFEYDGMNNKTRHIDYEGNETIYSYDANDHLLTQAQPEGRNIVYTNDAVGNRLSETILNQQTIYTYDDLNRVTHISQPLGRINTIEYDPVGNVTRKVDALNRETSFVYDEMNRLLTERKPLSNVSSQTYDFNGNKRTETDANGSQRRFDYDSLDRLITITDGNSAVTTNEYDAVGNLIAVIDGRNNRTEFKYDSLNRKDESIDANEVLTSFVYDAVGNLRETHPVNGNVVTNHYTALNQLERTEDTLGVLVEYTYDKNGNLETETDGNGNASTNIYDGLNRLVEQRLPEDRTLQTGYDVYNNKVSETDAKNHITSFSYDDLNQLRVITFPDTETSSKEYDLVGNIDFEIDRRGNRTDYSYDALNRLTNIIDPLLNEVSRTYYPVGTLRTETNKKGIVTEFQYDNENRPTVTTKAGLKIIEIEYDEVGNKEFETDSKGNTTAFLYTRLNQLREQSSPLAAITRYTYNDMGLRETVTDPEGRTTTFAYTVRNELFTSTNNQNETTTYTYDNQGNQLTKQLPLGNTWVTEYDAANRPFRITAPDLGITEYTFDRNGNIEVHQDALLQRTSYTYDELNRKLSVTYPDSIVASYDYDENGNLDTMVDANGRTVSYVYDVLNRKDLATYAASGSPSANDIISIDYQYDPNNNLTDVIETFNGGSVRTTNKLYDDFDRETRVTNGDGKELTYGYDTNGNRERVTDSDGVVTTYFYDELNRVRGVINSQGITNYAYDRSSRQINVNYPNGTSSVKAYDNAGRTQTITNYQDTSVISIFDYQLDANGNREIQTETQGALVEVTNYDYDENDRLLETIVTVNSVITEQTNYTYDVNYNRRTEVKVESGVTTVNKSFDYNNRNQVTEVIDLLDANGTTTYGYDNNGNRIQKQNTQLTETYLYDVRDQLKEIQQGGSTIGQFLYDYQGLRVEKIAGGETKKYVYDDQSVLIQTDAAGNTLSKYDYGVNQLLSLNHVTEGAQFYLFDALGSPVNLTTTDGTVQARYQYDAFGNSRSQTGTSANAFGFTGHEKDTETGLYYFKARYYDSVLGQFLTQDAFEGMTDTPPSLHKYIYAYGNPTVYIDPDGNIAWIAAGRDQFKEWADNTIERAGNLNNGSTGERLLAVASGVGAGVARVGEGALATVNYAGNWLSMATGGFGNDEWGMEHAQEIAQSHDILSQTASTLASRDGRAEIGLAAYETYQKVKSGDTKALASWSAAFSEIGTGSVTGSGIINSSKTISNTTGIVKESVKSAAVKIKTTANKTVAKLKNKLINRLNTKSKVPNNSIDDLAAINRMSEGRFIPDDFGVTSIASDPKLHGLWTESLQKATSWGGKKNAYQKYLQIIDQGGTPSGKQLSNAFSTVQGYFSRGAQKADIALPAGDIHHWNFNKSVFSEQVFDPRNLFPTNSKIQHNSMHLNLGPGNGIDYNGPIIPTSELKFDSSFYPLPPSFFTKP